MRCSSKAGSGALTHGRPDSAGRAARHSPTYDHASLQRSRSARNAFHAERGDEIAAVIVEPVPANAGLYLPEPGYLERPARTLLAKHGALLIFDEVMTGFRLARGGYQNALRHQPGPHRARQSHRRRTAGRRVRRAARHHGLLSPDGPVYQAGTLSGNPLAMAAGLAQLRELERAQRLGAARRNRRGLRAWRARRLRRAGKNYTFQRIGSLFCLYFAERPVRNLADSMTQDRAAFRRFFFKALERGVYFAPSQFEAGFISLAHSMADIEETAAVVSHAMGE